MLALRLVRLGGRLPRLGGLLRWFVRHMSFAIPAARLCETGTLLAFRHPHPSYPVHILILPKRAPASWRELGPADGPFLQDLVEVVKQLVSDLGLERGGYRLLVNGGAYQEAPLLHFHLIAGEHPPG